MSSPMLEQMLVSNLENHICFGEWSGIGKNILGYAQSVLKLALRMALVWG